MTLFPSLEDRSAERRAEELWVQVETGGEISTTCWLFSVPVAEEKQQELVSGAPEAERVQLSDIYSQ